MVSSGKEHSCYASCQEAYLNGLKQVPRRRSERRWATRAVRVACSMLVRVAASAEDAPSALQRQGLDLAKLVQSLHSAAHIVA